MECHKVVIPSGFICVHPRPNRIALVKDNFKKAEPRNLSGIWKNKGFEKIEHLEHEI